MRITIYSTQAFDRDSFVAANRAGLHELTFLDARLDASTAALAAGSTAACLFVNDQADARALAGLATAGLRLVVLRSAGFDHVDLAAARQLGLCVARVPSYSPHSIAEHAVALMLMLNRKLHRAYNRVREGDFSLHGLLGFEMRDKTVGIIGTGATGAAAARILGGFGCRVLAHDVAPDPALAQGTVAYVALPQLLAESDIVSLHVPLVASTRHLIAAPAIAGMRRGAMLINTSRGGVIDTRAVIDALKSGRIGSLGLDVYEREAGLFFADRSDTVIADDVLARLLTFPNVVVTGHQAFLTREALAEIARVTLGNAAAFAQGKRSGNEVT